MLLALLIEISALATLTPDTDEPLLAATVKDVALTTLAAAFASLEAETENAPKMVRFASTTSALVAEKVTAARLTP
jgi:hypothetical protein